MLKPRITIIVPVYNVERYLNKCIDSILGQTFTDFELLLIDDGSTDNSGEICDEYATNDCRIHLFHKANGGVSSARNLGLINAKGKYIWLVDSDDWIEMNCLGSIISTMEQEQLDALQIGYYTVNDKVILPCNSKYRKTTGVLTSQVYVTPDLFIGGVCGTIFKRELAIKNSILFDEELKIAEDQLFFLAIFNYSKRVKRQNILAYYYRSVPTSATNTATEDQLSQSIKKIASFKFFNKYSTYCKYLMIIQFFDYLNLSKKNIFKLHRLVRKYIIKSKTEYIYFENRRKNILWCYLYLGLLFLIIYKILKFIKIKIDNANKTTSILISKN